jgi:ribonucleoside-triphosphate reductase
MTFSKILKRDGSLQDFDRRRIERAINAASKAVDSGLDQDWAVEMTDAVLSILEGRHNQGQLDLPSVEQVQDIVEQVLVESNHYPIAKAFILYRKNRQDSRSMERMMLDSEKLVDDYLKVIDWRISENSNMNYSLQGLNFYLASTIAAKYWLNKIYPPEVRDAHISAALHLHDLGAISVYCCGWDLLDLITQGFGGVPAKVESAPPRHLRTALGQLVNFFYTLQGESAGAVAVSNFDTLLAPFVRHDGLNAKQVKQAIQEFIFNMNVPTRVGFQTPFSNITLDLTVPSIFKDQPVVIGGEYQDTPYGDYQAEMDMINQAFSEVMLEGDSKGRVFTFPIPTYNLTPDFDWEADGLENIWKMTGKYGVPYFANFINSDMAPEDARSMCCRLRLDNRELRKRMGGMFAAAPLTGSVGVVTMNLPHIAHLTTDEAAFREDLVKYMEIAKTSLEIKRKFLENLTDQKLYPYSAHYLESVKARSGHYWSNHFSTIGLIGMNEACQMVTGGNIDTPEGKAFAERTMDFMLDVLELFKAETGQLYNLEATPAEGASYRLARADQKNYPGIKTAGTTDTPYYTNSTQLPVNFSTDLFEVLDHQDTLQTRYTGGTVVHIFLGEQIDDWKQVRRLVRTVAENYHLPYFTISPTFSICPVHGYIPGNHTFCPHPHSEAELEKYGIAVPSE